MSVVLDLPLKSHIAVWSDESTRDNDGSYNIVGCERNDPGYFVYNSGWATLDEARRYAADINRQAGLDDNDVVQIRRSAMAAAR